ncbi:hypothetical protein OPKNFCMD_4781 [Methylobacterium crusticola]|uniref:DUF3035 domain-containing protein n=1 Tax=Methylobacterium crusticola TaxID=1697972 RepID=A0ABQ4R3J0_9HYPH|nr:hypothetical protein [Methylobacterium crusticola]GJD52019.1 hypothetical protein OPKNFCMD_4781 [Methylobacterium crusticola]
MSAPASAPRRPLHRSLPLAAGLAALALGGCVLDGSAVRDAAKSAGLGPKEVAAPDFVAQSRREGPGFLPVGVSAPPREIRAKSAAGVKDLEADLDASRQRNEAKGREAARVGSAAKPPAKAPPAE